MPPLSNLFRAGDAGHGGDAFGAPSIVCRPVARGEIESALRLLLASENGSASDEQVLDFLSFAVERKIDVNSIWVSATSDGQILWMLLPVVSAGRTMLLFTPGRVPRDTPVAAIADLVESVCAHFATRGTALAQMLIDPNDVEVIEQYTRCGFAKLAELVYLHRAAPKHVPQPPIPEGFRVETYSPSNHAHFATAIKQSYTASLDCPALNGLRDIEDVMAGHKCSGEFDPGMWYLMMQGDAPAAVLLLGRTHNDSLELVYLGLSPDVRGEGIGDWLMQLALWRVAADRRGRLSLAVDSGNAPALALYYRHGMQQIGSRVAMLRDLRALTTNAAADKVKVQSVQQTAADR